MSLGWLIQNSVYDIGMQLQVREREGGMSLGWSIQNCMMWGCSFKQGREREREREGWLIQNSVYDIGMQLQARGREREGGRDVSGMVDSKLYDVECSFKQGRERGRDVTWMVDSKLCV